MRSDGREAPPPAEDRSPPSGVPSGVLVVDDERPIVDLLTRYLGQHGFRAVGAYSPDQARQLVLSDPAIGVVISDVRMPGQSGLELLQHVKSRFPQLPVIIMTAYSDLESAVAAFQGGAF